MDGPSLESPEEQRQKGGASHGVKANTKNDHVMERATEKGAMGFIRVGIELSRERSWPE